MVAGLSEKEVARIQTLCHEGVLKNIETKMFEDTRHGTILVPCADGQHFDDLFHQHTALCTGHDNHPLALNGGALLIPRRSPLRRLSDGSYGTDDEVLLRHIAEAVRLGKGRTVILYAHAPCGMARMHDLSIDDELALLTQAKERVREHVHPLGVTEVRLWFHVYYPNGQRRTYHLCHPSWKIHVRRYKMEVVS